MQDELELEEPLEDELPEEEEPEPVDPTTLYWADRPADLVVAELKTKEKAFYDFLGRRGFGQAWIGAYCGYYGLDPDSLQWSTQSIGYDGDEAELLRFRINEFRSYVRQSTSMAIGQRPAFQALAQSDDYESLSQVEASDTAINAVYQSRYGERKERSTVEKGDLFGVGWTWVGFDPDGGEEIEVDIPLPPEMGGGPSPQKQMVRSGEIIIKSKAPWDVFYEPYVEDYDDHVWRCARDKVSKWEVAARYPEHRERILQLSCSDEFAIETFFGFDYDAINTEELIVKHFYHAKTRALPQGRYLVYVADLCLYDGPIPFRSLPFADYNPSPYIGTALGYADNWDLLPIGQMLDQMVSDIASNLATFGRQTVFTQEGTDWDPDLIANGMRVLTLPPGAEPPQALNLAELPAGAQWFLGFLESKFQSLSGLNSTARGQSDANVTSGTMAALFHSIAIEVNSAKQLAVDAHRERTANLILNVLKDFMQHPMLLEIVGADERPYLQAISKDVFKGVSKVVIKTSNPMMRSQAGRLEIAQMLLKIPNVIQTPQQIIEVLVSGQIKPLYKAPRSEMLRIAWENEALAAGPATTQKPDQTNPVNPDGTPRFYETVDSVPVLVTDNPQKHLTEHLSVIASKQSSENPAIIKATLAHCYEHVRVWKEADPALCALLGFPPPPANPMGLADTQVVASQAQQSQPANDNGKALAALNPKERDSSGVQLPKPAQPPGVTAAQQQ